MANPYSSGRRWYQWDNSYVRMWLNSTFKSAAFTKEERAAIIQTEVKNINSEGFVNERSDHWGNNTKDDIFILSYQETQEYLTGINGIQATTTTYAKSQTNDPGYYWLRSPDYGFNKGTGVVFPSGQFGYVNPSSSVGVRPAMWVDIDAAIEAIY
jgi:hypothetical protein